MTIAFGVVTARPRAAHVAVDAGAQVGATADFGRSTAHETVTLLPNGHAVARLQVAQALNYPKSNCAPTSATRLRVYPPGSKASL